MNWAFQIVLGLALAWIVFGLLRALFGTDFRACFYTSKGLQALTTNDVTPTQRLVVIAIAATPSLTWIYGLIELAFASVHFRRGEVFSEAVIRRFQGFGWSLVLNSIAEAAYIPAIVGYLEWAGKIAPPESKWQYLPNAGALDTLLAALLVAIVAKIMRIAMQIHEETQLTI